MSDSSHGIPSKGGNNKLVVGGIIMLLAAGGLVAYKLAGSSEQPKEEAKVAPAPTPPKAAPILDNAPPPPPSEDALAEQEKAVEVETPSTKAKGPAGPPGCGGTCSGSAGADLRNALAVRGASARSCYNTALRRNSTLEGKMTVSVRLSPSGAVCSVGIGNNTLGDAAVASCVSAQFRSSKFPAPQGGCVDTAVPLNFTSQK